MDNKDLIIEYDKENDKKDIYGEIKFESLKESNNLGTKFNIQKIITKIIKIIIYLILLLIFLVLIIFQLLPENIKSAFNKNMYRQLFQIRFDYEDINFDDTVENILNKHCSNYVNKDICEETLLSKKLHSSVYYGELYDFCKKEENSQKKYCNSNYNHMKIGHLKEKLPILEPEFEKWIKENNIKPDMITLSINSKTFGNYNNNEFIIEINNNSLLKEKVNNDYLISKGIGEKFLEKYYYGSKASFIKLSNENIDLENFKKILDILKEEIDNLGNDIQNKVLEEKNINKEQQINNSKVEIKNEIFIDNQESYDDFDKQTINEIVELINSN